MIITHTLRIIVRSEQSIAPETLAEHLAHDIHCQGTLYWSLARYVKEYLTTDYNLKKRKKK